MSPLEVSMSTSAPRVGGTLRVTSPEPVSTLTFQTLAVEIGGDRAAAGLAASTCGAISPVHLDVAGAGVDGELAALEVGGGARRPSRYRSRAIPPAISDDGDAARAGVHREVAPGLGHLHRAGAHVDVELAPGA